jgi:hypothetical protein
MDRTFTIQFGEDERLLALTALGFAIVRLPQGEPLRLIDGLINKLTRAAGKDVAHPGAGTASVAHPSPKPTAPQDIFQLDRKGNEQSSAPEGAELRTVKFLKAVDTPGKAGGKPYLKVVFANGTANCFDSRLWQGIKSTPPNAELSLWIVESGNYLNVVGVRA